MFLAAPTGNGRPLRVAPLATVCLVLLNVAVAAWTLPTSGRLDWERHEARLELAGPVRPWGIEEPRFAAPGGDVARRRVEAARHGALDARLAALDAEDPFQNWCYRAGSAPWRAVSALFLHADVLHLVSNLLVLAFVGAHLEQVWGPAGILLLYLSVGALSLVVDARTGPPTFLLGASGGVAALFGAYTVRLRRHPWRCHYVHLVYLRPHAGVFDVPCFAVAALWLAQQAIGAVWMQESGEGSVAFVSHLAGFALGAAAAGVMWLLRLEGDSLAASPGFPTPSAPARSA
jgi:membrane associated rhomboid family serine protease